MILLFGWVWLGPWITLAAAVGTLHGHPAAAGVLAAILAAWAAPLRVDDGSAAWPAFRDSAVWDCWRRYFGLVFVTPGKAEEEGEEEEEEEEGVDGAGGGPAHHPCHPHSLHAPLAPGEPHIIVNYPHGTVALGSFLSVIGDGGGDGFPTAVVGAIATILFHLPLLRQVHAWFGCIPARRDAIEAALARGRTVGLLPEGVAGIFAGADRSREVVLTAHRGFVKLALRACRPAGGDGGAGDRPPWPTPIVPCFIFGQSRLFSFAGSLRASRALRASVGVWWGRAGLPCLPRRVRLVMAAGRPVRLPPPAVPGRPSQTEIDAGFAAVLEELVRTYEAVRPGVAGYEGTRLVTK